MKGLVGLQTAALRAGDRVCCAVSGGADSVALLLAMAEANRAKESLGVVLRAVHVHHGLRGAEADGDEAFVRDLCAGLGVELRVEHVDTAGRQLGEREGLEEAARTLRYAVFWGQIDGGWADAVLTAHTLDDQAETVLMKLLRGAWTEGLGGISPQLQRSGPAIERPRALPGTAPLGGGQIIRPMLHIRRQAVEAYLRARNQGWREDSSNGDLRLTRNRVRHEVLPTLRTINPAAEEALARTAAIARDEEAYWQVETARLLPGVVLPGKPVRGGGRAVSTSVGEQALALQLDRLKPLAPAVRRRLVRAAVAQLGFRLGAEETAKILALGSLEEMAGISGRLGARLELRQGLRVERSARELRLARFGTAPAKEDVDIP